MFHLNKTVGETEIQLFNFPRSVFTLMSTIAGGKDVDARETFHKRVVRTRFVCVCFLTAKSPEADLKSITWPSMMESPVRVRCCGLDSVKQIK